MVKDNPSITLKNSQSDFFNNGRTLNINTRLKLLKALRLSILDHETEISTALKKDLGKPSAEIWLAEFYVVLDELNTVIKNLKFWAKPKRVKGKWLNIPSRDWIVPEPYGVTLHIAPWNYPFQLALNPLVGAVAAGNTVVLKPAEHAPQTSIVIENIIQDVFPREWVAVVQGGPETAESLLQLRWDYIFFTGGVRVGKLVAKAAAEYITPTTLELGGKNPCIVDHTANIKVSARRIAWGKYMNCGQICMSPDYLIVHQSKKELLVKALKSEIIRMYGDNPKNSEDYARLVHKRHANNMVNLLRGQNILYGGESDISSRYVAPTIVAVESLNNLLMQDEIFGPILPILIYKKEVEIDNIVQHFDKPLSFYVFSERKKWANRLMKKHSYGGGMINDVIVYFTNQRLPFGGVGNSGLGNYHGKYSFDTFTHLKSYVERPTWFDPIQRYAPYGKSFTLLQKILRLFI